MTKISDLLVSTFIIGTISSMQPFHNLIGKAREVEAKIVISTVNILQQPFLIENQRFASTLEELALGIPTETENYKYKIFAVGQTQALVTATAKQRGARSYAGAISVVKDNMIDNSIIVAVCETEQPSLTPPDVPQISGEDIKCPTGMTPTLGALSHETVSRR